METDSHKLFRKLQRQVYSDAKNNMICRYKSMLDIAKYMRHQKMKN